MSHSWDVGGCGGSCRSDVAMMTWMVHIKFLLARQQHFLLTLHMFLSTL